MGATTTENKYQRNHAAIISCRRYEESKPLSTTTRRSKKKTRTGCTNGMEITAATHAPPRPRPSAATTTDGPLCSTGPGPRYSIASDVFRPGKDANLVVLLIDPAPSPTESSRIYCRRNAMGSGSGKYRNVSRCGEWKENSSLLD